MADGRLASERTLEANPDGRHGHTPHGRRASSLAEKVQWTGERAKW